MIAAPGGQSSVRGDADSGLPGIFSLLLDASVGEA
jgi:hypothetical protein